MEEEMGIFQNHLKLHHQVNEVWLDECSQKIKKSVNDLNLMLYQTHSSEKNEDWNLKLFEHICSLFIQNKSELKINKILKVQILKVLVELIQETKGDVIEKSLQLLSPHFIENNIFEEYNNEEIQDLYIFSYLDVNDLVDALAAQNRFHYYHHPKLEVTSEVLVLAKNISIILPAQKLSLFYTRYKQYLLKHLIDPSYKFNHIYQNTEFLLKFLVNHYIFKLTKQKIEVF